MFIELLFGLSSICSEESLVGVYVQECKGTTLTIKADHTFDFTARFDVAVNWAVGNWSLDDNLLYLTTTPIYDTLEINGKDSLLLSIWKIPKRYKSEKEIPQTTHSQIINFVPNILVVQKDILYRLNKKGKIDRSKRTIRYIKKYRCHSYFRKQTTTETD